MGTNTKIKSNKKQKEILHISGAEAVVRCLLAEGADLVYGYPGGAIMPILSLIHI